MAQVIKADLDDIVFAGREQRYGAYDLRTKYPYRLFIALLIIMGVFGLAVALPTIIAAVRKNKDTGPTNVSIELTELPPPPPPDKEATPPPPPPPPPKPQIKTVAFKIPEPKPADEIEEEQEVVEVEKLADAPNIGLENKEGNTEGYFDGDLNVEEAPDVVLEEPKEEPADDAFIFVQEEPKPVNMADIKKLVGYPQIARDAGIQGDVVLRILVDEKGNYVKHKIIKQAHPILAQACEAQVPKLKFTPAIQGGKSIKFWVNVPFKFTLVQ